jgi:16S rRNA (guanine(1405)-N(7))-methyltransferase
MVKEKELVAAIKAKKGLTTLDEKFIQEKVDKFFAGNLTYKKKFDESVSFAQFSRSKIYEELLKRIRKELRAVYGVFQVGDRDALLIRLRDANSSARQEIIDLILQSHTSTKERMPHYAQIYQEICSRIKPKTVVDLGCGMNPLAYRHFVENGYAPKIIVSDISAKDMEYLQSCFTVLKISGTAISLDLTKDYKEIASYKGDVMFLFKLLDSLEESHRHISYKLFENIKTDWIVASFPTKSLGGKKSIARAGRTWFERLLKRKELTWETFSVENELFYVIKNH